MDVARTDSGVVSTAMEDVTMVGASVLIVSNSAGLVP